MIKTVSYEINKVIKDAIKSCDCSWFIHCGDANFDSSRLALLILEICKKEKEIKKLNQEKFDLMKELEAYKDGKNCI